MPDAPVPPVLTVPAQPLPIHLRPPAPRPTPDAELDSLHDHLLLAFIEPDFDLRAVADRFALSLLDVVRWFNSPRAQHDLEALRAVAQFRAQLLADLNLPAAVTTLHRVSASLARLRPEEGEISTHIRINDAARRNATALQRLARRTSTPGITLNPGGAPPDEIPPASRALLAEALAITAIARPSPDPANKPPSRTPELPRDNPPRAPLAAAA